MVSPSLPALAAAFPDSAGMVTFSRNRIAHLPDVWVRGEHPTSGRKSAGSGQRLQRRAVALSLLGEEGRDVHEDPVVLDQVAAHAERARSWKRPRYPGPRLLTATKRANERLRTRTVFGDKCTGKKRSASNK